MAILMNDMWHSAVNNFGWVICRTLWVKFKISRINVSKVVAYGPTKGDVEEREKFWNDLDSVADRVGNGYRLCVLQDLRG